MSDCWPEQEAIDSWFKAHNLEFRNEVLLVLKNEVTKPRIEVQDKLRGVEGLLVRIKEILISYSNNDVMGMGADEAIAAIDECLER